MINKFMRLFVSILFVSTSATAAPGGNAVVPQIGWFDSYSANGRCYIDSTFDHGIGSVLVSTPIGPQTVRQVAAKLGPGPGRNGNPLYNDVQCGNGPANSAGDEDYDQCPGRVDQGPEGCSVIGPKWDLQLAYGGASLTPSVPAPQSCDAIGSSLAAARDAFSAACSGHKRVDCDPVVRNGANVWMCASYNITAADSGSGGGASPATPPTTQAEAGRCDALGDTLGAAIAAYAASCSAPRRDCDPTGNRTQYLCASYSIVSTPTVSQPANPAPAPEPSEPAVQAPVVQPAGADACEATGASLGEAIAAYTAQCTLQRKDCDPVSGGYKCASYLMGAQSAAQTPDNPTPAPAPAPTAGTIRIEAETQAGAGWVNSGSYIEYTGKDSYASPTYGSLIYTVNIPSAGDWEMRWRARAVKQTPGRSDLHNDAWAKMNGNPVAGYHDVRSFRKVFSTGNGSWQLGGTVEVGSHNFSKFRQRLAAGQYQFQISGRSNGYAIDYIEFTQINGQVVAAASLPPAPAAPSLDPLGGIAQYLHTFKQPYVDGDLLSLHWDSSPDPDDMQAMILTREILDDLPQVDYIAVNGAKRAESSSLVAGSSEHMRTMFPSAYEAFRNGLGAAAQRDLYASTVNTVATAWALTLASGHRVHVAEGGPSNFTASVIEELRRRNVSESSLKNIRVVQHSWGWNEKNTNAASLLTVRRYADYIRIANGNQGDGDGSVHTATPDFARSNDARCAAFRARAAETAYRAQWQTAKERLVNRCDGSDAVAVLWILGIPTALVPTLEKFADHYF